MATRRRRRDDNATSRPRRWRDAPLDEPPGALCPGRSCVIALTSRVTTTCLQARSVRLTTPLTPDLAGSEPMGPSEPGLVWSRSAPRSVSRRSARARSPSRQGVPSRGGRHNRASARAAGGSDQQARQPLPSNGRATDSTSRQPRQEPRPYDRATDSTTIRLANRSAPAAAPRTGTDHQAHTGRPPSDDRATDSTVDAAHQPLPTYGRPPDRHPPASPPRAPPTYDRATCSTVQQAHQPLPTCGRPPDSHRPAGPHRPTPVQPHRRRRRPGGSCQPPPPLGRIEADRTARAAPVRTSVAHWFRERPTPRSATGCLCMVTPGAPGVTPLGST